jgi:hypothetical protein
MKIVSLGDAKNRFPNPRTALSGGEASWTKAKVAL